MTELPDLPDDYTGFLNTHSGKQPWDSKGVEWWLATSKELSKKVNIDGKQYPYINQLLGYTNTLKEMLGGDATTDEDGNEFSFSRLEAGLAFATGDGDVLFFDPSDNYSVWCFCHDGGDVERQSPAFGDWISSAELLEDY